MKPEKMENTLSGVLFSSTDLYTDGSVFLFRNHLNLLKKRKERKKIHWEVHSNFSETFCKIEQENAMDFKILQHLEM